MYTFLNHIIDLQACIEKLYREKKITTNNDVLLEIKDKTFSELLDEINPSKIIGFSTNGDKIHMKKLLERLLLIIHVL